MPDHPGLIWTIKFFSELLEYSCQLTEAITLGLRFQFLNASPVLGMGLSALHRVSKLTLTTVLWSSYYSFPQFPHELSRERAYWSVIMKKGKKSGERRKNRRINLLKTTLNNVLWNQVSHSNAFFTVILQPLKAILTNTPPFFHLAFSGLSHWRAVCKYRYFF